MVFASSVPSSTESRELTVYWSPSPVFILIAAFVTREVPAIRQFPASLTLGAGYISRQSSEDLGILGEFCMRHWATGIASFPPEGKTGLQPLTPWQLVSEQRQAVCVCGRTGLFPRLASGRNGIRDARLCGPSRRSHRSTVTHWVILNTANKTEGHWQWQETHLQCSRQRERPRRGSKYAGCDQFAVTTQWSSPVLTLSCCSWQALTRCRVGSTELSCVLEIHRKKKLRSWVLSPKTKVDFALRA